MKQIVVLFAFLAASCQPPTMDRADEAYDLANSAQADARTALANGTALWKRVDDLEAEKDQLQKDLADLRSEFEDYKSDSKVWHHQHYQ